MRDDKELRAEMEKAVAAALAEHGPAKFRPIMVVEKFAGRKSRAVLFRMVKAIIASGIPQQKELRKTKEKMKRRARNRAAMSDDPAEDCATEAIAYLPAVPSISDISGTTAQQLVDRLNACIQAADDVMQYARHPDGKVKNAKLLLSAAEHMRRVMDSCRAAHEAMTKLSNVEKFHQMLISAIASVAPEKAEEILDRFRRIALDNGGTD